VEIVGPDSHARIRFLAQQRPVATVRQLGDGAGRMAKSDPGRRIGI